MSMLKRPKHPRTVTHEFISQPWRGGCMSGTHGSESWDSEALYGDGGSMGGPSIFSMMGRFLHEGTRVRVTVEVLEEAKVGPLNPWHRSQDAKRRRERRKRARV